MAIMVLATRATPGWGGRRRGGGGEESGVLTQGRNVLVWPNSSQGFQMIVGQFYGRTAIGQGRHTLDQGAYNNALSTKEPLLQTPCAYDD